ncbi:MAG TPA: polyphosphate kinase 2 family protein [Candidatus Bathyarchaeia archaeon]|nr:polyphosphate kinase 2 family protein [Candidatus Bathyarchaeia archaeon]
MVRRIVAHGRQISTTDTHVGRYRLEPGHDFEIEKLDPNDTSGFEGKPEDEPAESTKLNEKLRKLQELLYAEHKHKVLVILQAMDTGGKDGVIHRVFQGVNPQGVRVAHFGVPTSEELSHDFLWRIHSKVAEDGEIVIFNRSHYEGVLVERVHKLVPEEIWKLRYRQINDFERLLSESNTVILKFYLHISPDEQKKRLQERLDDPAKEWKFSVNDLPERKFWKNYMSAYEDALNKTTTEWAPWHTIPSNHKWFRDLAVSRIIVKALEKLVMKYPKLDNDPRSIIIK